MVPHFFNVSAPLVIPCSPRSGSFTRASSIHHVFPTLESSFLSPKPCCAFPTRCGYGHIPFKWKALPHCVIKISSLFRRSGSRNWDHLTFSPSTSICSSVLAPNMIFSTSGTSLLFTTFPMKLMPDSSWHRIDTGNQRHQPLLDQSCAFLTPHGRQGGGASAGLSSKGLISVAPKNSWTLTAGRSSWHFLPPHEHLGWDS